MLVQQGALEQRSHLKVCLGNVHSLLLALQELYARMKAQLFWGVVMVMVASCVKARVWFLLQDVGGAPGTTVFPGKFCWAYSTRSLETPLLVQGFS